MTAKKKVLIYPLTFEILSMLRSDSFTSKYKEIMVSTYKGSGMNGFDCGSLDLGEKTGVVIEEDYELLLKRCDEVLLYTNTKDTDLLSDIYEKKAHAEKLGKVVSLILSDKPIVFSKERAFIDSLKNIHIDITKDRSFDVKTEELIEIEGLVDITVPIVGIVGNSDSVGKYELQIQMKDELSKRGYKVSLITSNQLGEFVGGYSFPVFMTENNYSDKMKILLFNRFLRFIELEDEPDIIIIGVPGGIMPATRRIVGDFGMLANKTYKAATPDYFIVSMNFEAYTKGYFEELNLFVKYNYGCNLNAIKIKNSKTDWEDAEVTNRGKLLSYSIDPSNVNNLINKLKQEIDLTFISSDKDSVSGLIDNVEDELESNESIVVF